MDAKTTKSKDARPAIDVNENLSIELTLDEILDDLLYPATAAGVR